MNLTPWPKDVPEDVRAAADAEIDRWLGDGPVPAGDEGEDEGTGAIEVDESLANALREVESMSLEDFEDENE